MMPGHSCLFCLNLYLEIANQVCRYSHGTWRGDGRRYSQEYGGTLKLGTKFHISLWKEVGRHSMEIWRLYRYISAPGEHSRTTMGRPRDGNGLTLLDMGIF